MIKVEDFMIHEPFRLYIEDTISTAKKIFINSALKSIPVVDVDNKFKGVLHGDEVLGNQIPETAFVCDHMDKKIGNLGEKDDLSIINKLSYNKSCILPVCDSFGYLVGILPKPDILAKVYSEITMGLKVRCEREAITLNELGVIVVEFDGKILYFNRRAEDIIGFKAKDIIGIHINKIIHDSRLTEVAKKGKPQLKQRVLADNKNILCSDRFPLALNGEIIGAVGIFTDITEESVLQDKVRNLRRANKELVGILESITDGIIVINSEGTIERVNRVFEKITGTCANDWLGLDAKEKFQFQGFLNIFTEDRFPKHKSTSFIEYINDKLYLITCNQIYDGDFKLTHIVLIFKDLTQVNEMVSNLQVTEELKDHYNSSLSDLQNKIKKNDMIANSSAMKRIMSITLRVAQVDSTILIMGETGVGKEVLARAIHKWSQRVEGPFIKLNCSAIPEQLLESELFGYESGAFTGAKKEGKPGLIEMADGGTLFLDEIGDLPLNIQVKFLRVLQEREIQRVGGVKTKKVDFRLIAATNRELGEMIKTKQFREDLFYRLNVVPLKLPPLRDRKEDIVPLIIFFLNKFNKKYGMNKKLSPEVIQSFLEYDWPGNIRELENTIERLMVTSEKNLIIVKNLLENTEISNSERKSNLYLKDVLEQTEKELIMEAYQHCKTTRDMAELLGISQSAVVKKMQKYKIKSD